MYSWIKVKLSIISWLLSVGVALWVSTPSMALPEASKSKEAIRSHMKNLYLSLMDLMPLTLTETQYFENSNHPKILASLKTLNEQAKALEPHFQKSHETKLIGHRTDFFESTEAAYTSFEKGLKNRSLFWTTESLSYCISCHESGSGVDATLSQQFQKAIEPLNLGTIEKARYLTIARQFGAAIDLYEKAILEEGMSLEEQINRDPYKDYLLLTIRVKSEYSRAQAFLKKAIATQELGVIRSDLMAWEASLQRINSLDQKSDSMTQIKQLITWAKETSSYPADRSGMVYYTQASKLLRDAVYNSNISDNLKLAEYYYLLGQCELVIEEDQYQPLQYFAESIRKAPKAPFAKQAYDIYEKNLVLSYSGSGGTFLPEDEPSKLTSLRTLVTQ